MVSTCRSTAHQSIVNGMYEKEGSATMKRITPANQFPSPRSIQIIFTMIAVILMVTACATDGSFRGSDSAQSQAKALGPSEGYDARLRNFSYPYETKTFVVTSQGQSLDIVYMDVRPKPESSNGQAVLLLHGKNFSGAYWANSVAPLVDLGYRVVVPDQIGFGKSSKPENFQYSFHGMASNTADLLASLGIENVHVVGHSMGGMVAARFALMFPERTASLILVNPIGLEDWKRKVPYRPVDWWFDQELKKTPDKVRAYMTASYFDGVWKPEYEPLVDLQIGWIKGPDYRQIAKNSALTYEMIFTQPVVYEFNLIQVPTLLIIGDRDRTALGKNLVSDEVRATLGLYGDLAKKTQAAIPGARLVLLPGVGHIPQYEAYEKYIHALTGFLDGQ